MGPATHSQRWVCFLPGTLGHSGFLASLNGDRLAPLIEIC